MKRIYIMMLIALCMVSCQVSDPSPKTVQWSDLRDYSIVKMGECVVMPAEVLETAICLDRYLNATDEEKLADTEFYGMISDYGDGTYGVRRKSKNVSFVVATGGKSIWDNDAQWQISTTIIIIPELTLMWSIISTFRRDQPSLRKHVRTVHGRSMSRIESPAISD